MLVKLGLEDTILSNFWNLTFQKFEFSFCFAGLAVQLIDTNFNSTVKPVHNGHPWDLKNVVVMQRVV